MHKRLLTVLALSFAVVMSASAADKEKKAKRAAKAGQAATQKFTPLFNGKDLTGWVPFLKDKSADPQDTFKVRDGIIVCTGTPPGYIRTEKPYNNYVLRLEYRFERPSDLKSDAQFQGNSGVLVHITGPDKIWPKSQEVQIHNPTAGSIFGVAGGKSDNKVAVKNKAKPVGEWNKYRIICRDGTIEAFLNGERTGKVTGSQPDKGYICVQSEGAEIHFRNIEIREIKQQ